MLVITQFVYIWGFRPFENLLQSFCWLKCIFSSLCKHRYTLTTSLRLFPILFDSLSLKSFTTISWKDIPVPFSSLFNNISYLFGETNNCFITFKYTYLLSLSLISLSIVRYFRCSTRSVRVFLASVYFLLELDYCNYFLLYTLTDPVSQQLLYGAW